MTDRDPLQTLWTSQAQAPFSMSLGELHARAARFQSRIRRRNLIEYLASAFVISVFGWIGLGAPTPMIQIGAGLIVLSTLFVCWKLHQLARAATNEEMRQAQSWADFHRGELTRQRDALAKVWQWYLAPFAPGMLVFLAGAAFTPETPAPLPARAVIFGLGVCVVGITFAAVHWLNSRAAAALTREIAALDQARAA